MRRQSKHQDKNSVEAKIRDESAIKVTVGSIGIPTVNRSTRAQRVFSATSYES